MQREIVLSEGISVDPDKNTFDKVSLQFSQENKSNKQPKIFYIFDDKYLGVKNYDPSSKEYWINLLFIDPKAKRKKHIPWAFCFVALGLITLASLLVIAIEYTDFVPLYPFGLPIIILLVTCAIILIMFMVHRSTDALIFYSRNGKIAVAEFYYNNPNKNEFGGFIKQLVKRIATIKSNNDYNKSQLLPAELAEHRRLNAEGIVPNKDYELAKANILKRY